MEVAKKSSYSCCNLQKCTEEKFWIFVSFSVVVHAQKLSEKWKSQCSQSPKTVFEPISKQKRWCLLCLSEKSWESMTLDTIMFVSQATKRCPEREEVERKKERTELKKVCFLWWQRQSLWEIPKPRSMTCFDGSPTFYGLHK